MSLCSICIPYSSQSICSVHSTRNTERVLFFVIPGEQRETRNPGASSNSRRLFFLDSSLRWNDESG